MSRAKLIIGIIAGIMAIGGYILRPVISEHDRIVTLEVKLSEERESVKEQKEAVKELQQNMDRVWRALAQTADGNRGGDIEWKESRSPDRRH